MKNCRRDKPSIDVIAYAISVVTLVLTAGGYAAARPFAGSLDASWSANIPSYSALSFERLSQPGLRAAFVSLRHACAGSPVAVTAQQAGASFVDLARDGASPASISSLPDCQPDQMLVQASYN